LDFLSIYSHALGLGTYDPRHSAFQEYAVIHGTTIARIPSSISFERATVLPLALSTASAGLYQPGYLELPYPSATTPSSTGKSILIWGGSASVGSAAIQLAKASGLRVVSTASPANHDFVKSLGADVVVDYKDEKVVDKLVEALEGSEFAGVYDAISENGSVEASAQVATRVGGNKFIATVLPPPENLPEGVKAAGGELPFPLFFVPYWISKLMLSRFLERFSLCRHCRNSAFASRDRGLSKVRHRSARERIPSNETRSSRRWQRSRVDRSRSRCSEEGCLVQESCR